MQSGRLPKSRASYGLTSTFGAGQPVARGLFGGTLKPGCPGACSGALLGDRLSRLVSGGVAPPSAQLCPAVALHVSGTRSDSTYTAARYSDHVDGT